MASELPNQVLWGGGQDDAAEEEVSAPERKSIIELIQDLVTNVVRPLLVATRLSDSEPQAVENEDSTPSPEEEVHHENDIDTIVASVPVENVHHENDIDTIVASVPEETSINEGTLNDPLEELDIPDPTESFVLRNPPNSKIDLKQEKWNFQSKERICISVPCRYSNSGCKGLYIVLFCL